MIGTLYDIVLSSVVSNIRSYPDISGILEWYRRYLPEAIFAEVYTYVEFPHRASFRRLGLFRYMNDLNKLKSACYHKRLDLLWKLPLHSILRQGKEDKMEVLLFCVVFSTGYLDAYILQNGALMRERNVLNYCISIITESEMLLTLESSAASGMKKRPPLPSWNFEEDGWTLIMKASLLVNNKAIFYRAMEKSRGIVFALLFLFSSSPDPKRCTLATEVLPHYAEKLCTAQFTYKRRISRSWLYFLVEAFPRVFTPYYYGKARSFRYYLLYNAALYDEGDIMRRVICDRISKRESSLLLQVARKRCSTNLYCFIHENYRLNFPINWEEALLVGARRYSTGLIELARGKGAKNLFSASVEASKYGNVSLAFQFNEEQKTPDHPAVRALGTLQGRKV